ncbi:uncharacterized protein LOC107262404 [Ricinus communis]|uniref:uncharacterized protein LOC107262404 n=1 Tax=Ricinus communis TaxID=3988 RepID=UPI00201A5E01|nr:uncharacterized protein LOC107262404 [Ricinus communis]
MGPNKTYPVIVNAELNDMQTKQLLVILRKYRNVIGYTIDDIKGINLSFCMHKINLEDDHTSSIESQRRLNPNMMEVIKKEVLKLLDAWIIYPISDSKWVSPVQVVLEKGGLIENSIKAFMDDFSIYGTSFDVCLNNLEGVLYRCKEVNLILNWKKCHFMVHQGVILGHIVAHRGIEVDRAKIEVIERLPPPNFVKGVRSFLSHAGFYRRFIKNFSKIARPLTKLLGKDVLFVFTDICIEAFDRLKQALIYALVMQSPNWNLPFEIMCDASDYAVEAMLGQRKDSKLHAIHYTSKTLDSTQINYATTEKELLAVVYAMDKFWSYLVGLKVIIHTDHAALRTRKESKMFVVDHLCRLILDGEGDEDPSINDSFHDEQLLALAIKEIPWCIPESEVPFIISHCHDLPYGGHAGTNKTAAKTLQYGFHWPSLFKDVHQHVKSCDQCQRTSNISKRNEMPLNNILEAELFDVWGIDFMGPFPSSYRNRYILVDVDYVSKWVEAITTLTNDAQVVNKFFKKNIFPRFGVPRVLISDGGKHFLENQFEVMFKKYGVDHQVGLSYHPQSSGQVDISN